MLEITMSAVLISNRFTLGWYMGKIFALISTLFVLLVLLFEMTALYANLARSIIRQRGAARPGRSAWMQWRLQLLMRSNSL
jgi:hypothetical protein